MVRIVMALVFFAASFCAAAEDGSELANNPFARPDMTDSGVSSGDEPKGWPEQLRATLIDGARSLANIDGTLVTVGENVDGATVTHIGEGVVTLARGEKTRTLHLEDDAPTSTRRASRE